MVCAVLLDLLFCNFVLVVFTQRLCYVLLQQSFSSTSK